MWYCTLCQTIICQFCIQQHHNTSSHKVTFLNVIAKEKRQEIENQKEAVAQRANGLERKRDAVQGQLENIHTVRSNYEDQKKLFTDELQKIRKELDSLENNLHTQGRDFNEQLKSKEMKILKVYEEVSDDVDDCNIQINELDKMKSETDLDVVEQSTDLTMSKQPASETLRESTFLPTLEIPRPPDVPLALVRQNTIAIENILRNIGQDLNLSPVAAGTLDRPAGNKSTNQSGSWNGNGSPNAFLTNHGVGQGIFVQNHTLVATNQPQLSPTGSPMTTIQQMQLRWPRSRKIIRIVDPTSNTDITDAVMREGTSSNRPAHPDRSSTSSNPAAKQQLDDKTRAIIQASFAAQVALAAADTAKPPEQIPSNNSQGTSSSSQQPPAP